MMNCFPTIYENELLYSCISRYRRMTGIVNKKALMNDLYNQNVSLNSIYFPVHCEHIINNLPINNKITVDNLIKENTLFRVFSSFINEEKALLVYKGMKNSERFSPYSKLGLVGTKIEMQNNLLYCPECINEDMKRYGESYWRVLHQVPGVFYCDKHKIPLIKSNICSNDSRIDFVCVEDIDESMSTPAILDDKNINLNLKYIRMVEYLLKNDVKRREKDFFNNIYIDKLRDRGLTSYNGNLHIKELEDAFISFYSNDYLRLMQSEIDINNENNWLRKFIRKSNKQKHVLRHLLMIQFLNINIEELFDMNEAEGKRKYIYVPNPRLDVYEQRRKWIEVLKEHPNLNKSEYKKIGKGLYSWLYKNDNEWFEESTQKYENI